MKRRIYPSCPILLKREDDGAHEVITYTKAGHLFVIGRYSNTTHQQQLFDLERQKRLRALESK